MEIKEKQKSHNPLGNPYLGSWKKVGGFPWKLTEQEVVTLLSLLSKALEGEQYPYLLAVTRSGLANKMKLRKYEQETGRKGNLKCWSKIKYLMDGLNHHPGLMTTNLRTLIEGTPDLAKMYQHKTYEVVKPVTGNEVMILNKSDGQVSPLVHEEETKTNIMENILDKMQIVLDNISVKKIQSSNFGALSKGLENLMKSYQMFKGEVGSKTLMQVNIGNLTLEQKRDLSRNMAESKR
jgi:hypothetical protein